MSDKDFTSKLAAGMRRAKQPGTTEASVTPAAMTPAAAIPQESTARPSAATPSASPQDPWKELHPKRIWPD